jgi:hypothetical protein
MKKIIQVLSEVKYQVYNYYRYLVQRAAFVRNGHKCISYEIRPTKQFRSPEEIAQEEEDNRNFGWSS